MEVAQRVVYVLQNLKGNKMPAGNNYSFIPAENREMKPQFTASNIKPSKAINNNFVYR